MAEYVLNLYKIENKNTGRITDFLTNDELRDFLLNIKEENKDIKDYEIYSLNMQSVTNILDFDRIVKEESTNNWDLTPTSFAHTTDKELIMELSEVASIEIAYFTDKNKYGYSILILGEDGFVDKCSEDFADTIEELMELIKKDELAKPYLDKITAPTEAQIKELK